MTTRQIAESWELWQEYVDVNGTMTEAEFDDMDVSQRVALIEACFGKGG